MGSVLLQPACCDRNFLGSRARRSVRVFFLCCRPLCNISECVYYYYIRESGCECACVCADRRAPLREEGVYEHRPSPAVLGREGRAWFGGVRADWPGNQEEGPVGVGVCVCCSSSSISRRVQEKKNRLRLRERGKKISMLVCRAASTTS